MAVLQGIGLLKLCDWAKSVASAQTGCPGGWPVLVSVSPLTAAILARVRLEALHSSAKPRQAMDIRADCVDKLARLLVVDLSARTIRAKVQLVLGWLVYYLAARALCAGGGSQRGLPGHPHAAAGGRPRRAHEHGRDQGAPLVPAWAAAGRPGDERLPAAGAHRHGRGAPAPGQACSMWTCRLTRGRWALGFGVPAAAGQHGQGACDPFHMQDTCTTCLGHGVLGRRRVGVVHAVLPLGGYQTQKSYQARRHTSVADDFSCEAWAARRVLGLSEVC